MSDLEQDVERDENLEEQEPVNDWIEFTGDPNEEHGTTFLAAHTLPRGDALWKRNRITMRKDLTWVRDPLGAPVGQKGARFLLPAEDVPAEALALLEKTPGYKRVSE